MRILFTGGREWVELAPIVAVFATLADHAEVRLRDVTLVQGGALGGDQLSCKAAVLLGIEKVETYPAKKFESPRRRNEYMVRKGATVCVAAALKWDSGTGMCARMARMAGIPVIDIGVDTRLESRPAPTTVRMP